MGNKVAIGLAAAALVVAVFGSTSAGRAALDAVIPVPLAKRAYVADTAKNAIKVDNIKANRTATAGMLLPLDATGKFPVSVGAIGPVGQKGDKGDKGDKGKTGKDGSDGATNVVVRMSAVHTTAGSGSGNYTASCNQGERAVGGGAGLTTGESSSALTVTDGKPVPQTAGVTPTGWNAGVKWTAAGYTWAVYVICASP